MKKSRFTEVYSWRKQFRGMNVETLREFKRLQHENARLRKLLADRELEIDAMYLRGEAVSRSGSPAPVTAMSL